MNASSSSSTLLSLPHLPSCSHTLLKSLTVTTFLSNSCSLNSIISLAHTNLNGSPSLATHLSPSLILATLSFSTSPIATSILRTLRLFALE